MRRHRAVFIFQLHFSQLTQLSATVKINMCCKVWGRDHRPLYGEKKSSTGSKRKAAQPCTCSVGPTYSAYKHRFVSFIYLPIRILACKTRRIAPKRSCLQLKPWWVWSTTAMERRSSRIQRAGTHQPSPLLCSLPQNGMLFFTSNSGQLLIFVLFSYKFRLDFKAISQQKKRDNNTI